MRTLATAVHGLLIDALRGIAWRIAFNLAASVLLLLAILAVILFAPR